MTTEGGWAVEVAEVRRVFPRQRRSPERVALDGVSFRVTRGEWCALLGPNGAGKSTLMRILATLDVPDRGGVRVLGVDPVTDSSGVRRRIGVVFQRTSLDALLTVRENLLLHAALQGVDRARVRVEEEAERLGVADRLDDRVGTLSGGLVRRVDLARALLHEPGLLLLDEPTTGLDHDARMRFLGDLEERRRVTGLTIVMSTHLMDEAERAGEVILMARGRVVGAGAPDRLREGLGAALVRSAGTNRDALTDAGLEVRTTADGVVGIAEDAQVREAVERLAARGVAFAFGPPTLGDVYVSMTGQSLDGEAL